MDNISCIRKNWFPVFVTEINKATQVKIISPFISESMITPLLDRIKGENIEIITRFNLTDFFLGVSQLSALKKLVISGAHIRGIKGLHSKVYIFDSHLAIVSSANFTSGGLFNNYEFGIAVREELIVEECLNYFKDLYKISSLDLTLELLEEWIKRIDAARIEHPNIRKKVALPDFGSEMDEEYKNRHPQIVAENEKRGYEGKGKLKVGARYFIKFFGESDNRVGWNFSVKEEIKRAECHYACAWPKGKRPRMISDGDVIFMSRLTKKPNGHAIFGRAWGMAHVEGRDDATNIEIKRCPWKKRWPHYIRVFDPLFINGTMSQCVKLDDMMHKFGSESFISTSRNKQRGMGNTNPRTAFRQQACVELTPDAAIWLDQEFTKALGNIGSVEDEFLDSIPQKDNTNLKRIDESYVYGFFEQIVRLRKNNKILREWKIQDIRPFLKDGFRDNTIGVYPYNCSISIDGKIKGDYVKNGQDPKFYRIKKGTFMLIHEFINNIKELKPGQVIINEELKKIFKCSNTGGMRRSYRTNSLVIVSDHTRGIYRDKWIDGKLYYTGMGLKGDQSINFSQNKTLAESHQNAVTIHLFEVSEPMKYLYHGRVKLADKPYQEQQPDEKSKLRKVWIFSLALVDSRSL